MPDSLHFTEKAERTKTEVVPPSTVRSGWHPKTDRTLEPVAWGVAGAEPH